MDRTRCNWCRGNDLLMTYHDREWGVPVHDDKKHFEYLTLEAMQCGLSWLMMLKKRGIIQFHTVLCVLLDGADIFYFC